MWISSLKVITKRHEDFKEKIMDNVYEEICKKAPKLFCACSSWVWASSFGNGFKLYEILPDKSRESLNLGISIAYLDGFEKVFPFPPKITLKFSDTLENWLKKNWENYFFELPFTDLQTNKYKFSYREIVLMNDGKTYIKDFKFKHKKELFAFPWYSEIIKRNGSYTIALKYKNSYIFPIQKQKIVVAKIKKNEEIEDIIKKNENYDSSSRYKNLYAFMDQNQNIVKNKGMNLIRLMDEDLIENNTWELENKERKLEFNVDNFDLFKIEKKGYHQLIGVYKNWFQKEFNQVFLEQEKETQRFNYIPICLKPSLNSYLSSDNYYKVNFIYNSFGKIVQMRQ